MRRQGSRAGNHDKKRRRSEARAAQAGLTLLIDEAVQVDTPIGPVQILGFDFHFRDRERNIVEVCRANPKPAGALRLALLHDPGAFRKLPLGEGDLVLSGHTHGGQVGLVSFGLPWTLVSLVAKIPDHGLWARGRDRLYVPRHRPLRIPAKRGKVPERQSRSASKSAKNS